MGVIKVPTAEARTGPGEMPQFRAHSNASPEAFGSGVAKATQNLGAVVGEMAGLVEKYDDMEAQREAAAIEAEHEKELFDLMHGKPNEEGKRVGGLYNDPNVSPEERVQQAEAFTKELQNRRYKHGRTAGYLGNRLEKGLYGFASQAATIKMRQDEKAEAEAKEVKKEQIATTGIQYSERYSEAIRKGNVSGALFESSQYGVEFDRLSQGIYKTSERQKLEKRNNTSGMHLNGLKNLDPGVAIEMREHYLPGGVIYEQMNENDRKLAENHINSAVEGLAEMKVYENFRTGKHDYPDFDSFVDAQEKLSDEVKNNAKRNAPLLKGVYDKKNPKQKEAENQVLRK